VSPSTRPDPTDSSPAAWEFRARQLVNRVRVRLSGNASTSAALARLRRDGGLGPYGSRPIFVLGGGWRTGSTLLQRMLNQTGDLLIWGEPYSEGAIVQRLAESLTFLDPQRGRFHGRILPDDGALPPPDVWTANLTPPVVHLIAAQRAMLDRLFALPAQQHGCSRWGIKEVVWGRDVVDLLSLLYPDARFLLLVRDPLAQWRSYRPKTRRPWYFRWPDAPVGSPFSFGRLWDRLAHDFLAADAEVPQATLVRYEDLKDPAELARLTDFLELREPLRPDAPEVGSSRERAFFTDALPAWEKIAIRRLTASGAQMIGYV
jgi:Sulfotransferase family